MLGQFIRFGLIGVLAALLHFAIASSLSSYAHINVMYSNVAGFVCAFWVSFFGHHYFSFRASHLSIKQTLPKFACVALVGFLINENLLFIFKYAFAMPDSAALIAAILLTALISFVLNRYFAFF